MADPHPSSTQLVPPTPPCSLCDTAEHVFRADTSEYPHIYFYRCKACGQYWATSLQGDPILVGRDACTDKADV
jgi:hypothetical protein